MPTIEPSLVSILTVIFVVFLLTSGLSFLHAFSILKRSNLACVLLGVATADVAIDSADVAIDVVSCTELACTELAKDSSSSNTSNGVIDDILDSGVPDVFNFLLSGPVGVVSVKSLTALFGFTVREMLVELIFAWNDGTVYKYGLK